MVVFRFLAVFLLDLMLKKWRGLACTIITSGIQWSSVFLARILLDLTLTKLDGLARTIVAKSIYPRPFRCEEALEESKLS